jgi:hypothetical protein
MEGLVESDEKVLIGSDGEDLVAEITSRFPIGDYNGPIRGIFLNVGTVPCSLNKDLIYTIEGSFKIGSFKYSSERGSSKLATRGIFSGKDKGSSVGRPCFIHSSFQRPKRNFH